MKIQITSASWDILSSDSFVSVTLMTESGEITVLPGHEPMISVVRPGILHVEYADEGKNVSHDYATGGGVISITSDRVTIIAESVEWNEALSDVDMIEQKKKEAEAMMKSYQAEHKGDMDPKHVIDLEYEFLRYTALHELHKRMQHNPNARR